MTADLTKTDQEISMLQSSSKPSTHLDTDCKKDIWTAVTVSLSLSLSSVPCSSASCVHVCLIVEILAP